MIRVTQIKIEVTVGGQQKVAVFLSKDKIDELMKDEGSLGQLLRDLARSHED